MAVSRQAGDRTRPRLLALLAVIAFHAALVLALLNMSRMRSVEVAAEDFVSTLIDLPYEVEPGRRPTAVHAISASERPLHTPPGMEKSQRRDITAVPPTAPWAVPEESKPDRRVDWSQQAEESAGAITSDSQRSLTEPDDPRSSRPRPLFAPPAHEAGEQYRLGTGESVVWVSSRCYLISDPPRLGGSDVAARGAISRTVCPRDSGEPRGDMFADMPLYKKLHDENALQAIAVDAAARGAALGDRAAANSAASGRTAASAGNSAAGSSAKRSRSPVPPTRGTTSADRGSRPDSSLAIEGKQ